MTIKELKEKLSKEEDAEKKKEIQTQIDKLEKDDEGKIPYYKFKKIEDKLADALSKLEALEEKKKSDKEEGLKEQGKFKELVETKNKEVEALKGELKTVNELIRQGKINSIILNEIKKGDPQDEGDILKAIDESKLVIKEEKDGGIIIEGIDKAIEAMKEKKPWLFKEVKPNDLKNNEENKTQKVNTESVETEFRALNEKSELTLQENLKMQKLGEQLTDLRGDK